jgi:hypothetical protein
MFRSNIASVFRNEELSVKAGDKLAKMSDHKSKSKSHCDWRSVSQYVLVSSPNMGLLTIEFFSPLSYCLVIFGAPSLTRGRVCYVSDHTGSRRGMECNRLSSRWLARRTEWTASTHWLSHTVGRTNRRREQHKQHGSLCWCRIRRRERSKGVVDRLPHRCQLQTTGQCCILGRLMIYWK